MRTESIRVTGTVQGVGFRPTVWRLASECGVVGSVRNDANGVLIEAWGEDAALNALIERIEADRPPLSIIDGIQRTAVSLDGPAPSSFTIEASASGRSATNVAADAATCSACLEDISDPGNRRYRYPFTNCTHCGPRLSIVHTIPYDRSNTSMAAFEMCDACRAEYEDPADRRFHAQPNACPDCGPSVWIEVPEGSGVETRGGDAIIEVARQLKAGRVVAIKGIGGFHLACLATNSEAVDLLRQRKRRYQKALALMARDVTVVRRFAKVSAEDELVLQSTSAPIVVLQAEGETLPDGVSPGQDTLGFMLPYTPLHHLLLAEFDEPLVMTSGNRSDEPQVIDNDDAREKLTGIADLFLMHDRDIVNRLDDSVVQSARSAPQVLRRARGHAPEPLNLHSSFADAPNVLALGGELKNTFCLLSNGRAVVSQHIGDMEEASAVLDYLGNIELYQGLYDFDADAIAVDRHPDYVPNKLAAEHFPALPRIETQHHHAHVAACMAEHGFALNTEPVLGVVLDGLGFGDDGTFWGGELLVADFAGYERAGRFLPVVMPGGSRAMKEPWRNAWAHLDAAFGWEFITRRYNDLGAIRELQERPVGLLDQMRRQGINAPLGSSAGRLFDAVAAILGICADGIAHEAQAAMELECLAASAIESERGNGYSLDVDDGDCLTISWQSLWSGILDDLRAGASRSSIAARFHIGLGNGLAAIASATAQQRGLTTTVLNGGVFQNRLLLEIVSDRLQQSGLAVLSPSGLPANDGGLSLGQAAIAARILSDA